MPLNKFKRFHQLYFNDFELHCFNITPEKYHNEFSKAMLQLTTERDVT